MKRGQKELVWNEPDPNDMTWQLNPTFQGLCPHLCLSLMQSHKITYYTILSCFQLTSPSYSISCIHVVQSSSRLIPISPSGWISLAEAGRAVIHISRLLSPAHHSHKRNTTGFVWDLWRDICLLQMEYISSLYYLRSPAGADKTRKTVNFNGFSSEKFMFPK